MPFEVKHKIAIITGSAQGFGKEFAKRLLEKGGKVCISDVNEEQGLKTTEEFGKIYGKNDVTFKRYFKLQIIGKSSVSNKKKTPTVVLAVLVLSDELVNQKR